MSSRTESEIPIILVDEKRNIRYERKRLFGKGGFAKCYEIRDMKTDHVYAGKIVPKNLMTKSGQKEKMVQEIAIHRSLSHVNIVRFLSNFDDQLNVYIVLELCKQRSMMELHRRRQVVTDYECRFYVHQILQGVQYLHDNKIIHRDLKLGNLFLNDQLHVKIGDFGLATRIEYQGERKKTLCGTPNYIAPEILNKKGHSYEVDVWSIGCVMYTLLVGQPPFETKTLKDTYEKIRKCDYNVPTKIRKVSADMIISILQGSPESRPTVKQCLENEFFRNQYIPKSLPISCLSCEPRIDQLEGCRDNYSYSRKPLHEVTDNNNQDATFLRKNLNDPITASGSIPKNNLNYKHDIDVLLDQLTKLLNSKPKRFAHDVGDENTDPSAQPLFWISKWVDYSDKYGFGYQLCDEGMGVMYNDTTKLIMLSNGINVHFIDREGSEKYMTVEDYPKDMEKKMKLLSYFKRYMTEHLVRAGGNVSGALGDQLSRIPHMHTWFRTTVAVVMHLTNGTVQMNFADHLKIIICPRMAAVTFIDHNKQFRTFKFETISKHGCTDDLYTKLRYAHEKLKVLLEKLSQ